MQISQNSTTFNGSFKIIKLSKSRKEFLKNYAADSRSIYYENFCKSGSRFISVLDKFDKPLFDTLRQGNAIFTYYPQIGKDRVKKKTEKQISAMINNLIPSPQKVLDILNLVKIRIQSPIISDYLHGATKVINPCNNDIVLISPQNSYGTHYVKFIPNVSQTKDFNVRRYAVMEQDNVKIYNSPDNIADFLQKYKSTLIFENKG